MLPHLFSLSLSLSLSLSHTHTHTHTRTHAHSHSKFPFFLWKNRSIGYVRSLFLRYFVYSL